MCMNRAALESVGADRLARVFFVCDLLVAGLLVVNATGLLPFDPIVLYLANLAYQLTGTAITFVRFVAPLWRADA